MCCKDTKNIYPNNVYLTAIWKLTKHVAENGDQNETPLINPRLFDRGYIVSASGSVLSSRKTACLGMSSIFKNDCLYLNKFFFWYKQFFTISQKTACTRKTRKSFGKKIARFKQAVFLCSKLMLNTDPKAEVNREHVRPTLFTKWVVK